MELFAIDTYTIDGSRSEQMKPYEFISFRSSRSNVLSKAASSCNNNIDNIGADEK